VKINTNLVRSEFLLLIIVIVVPFVFVQPLSVVFNTNLLSVEYFHEVKRSITSCDRLPVAPETHPRAPFWNAITAVREGNYQYAFDVIQSLVDSEDIFTLELKAWAHVAKGDYQNAIQIHRQLNNPKELLRICQTAKDDENFEDAITACYAAWELDYTIATILLAELLIKKEDLATAEVILQHSLEQTTNHRYRQFWLFELATVRYKQERWAEYIEIQLQGIAELLLIGTDLRSIPRRYADLAWAYHMIGQDPEAIRKIEEAINSIESNKNPYISHVWIRAAQIYESAGLFPQALAAYEIWLELEPYSTTARDAIERLSDSIQK